MAEDSLFFHYWFCTRVCIANSVAIPQELRTIAQPRKGRTENRTYRVLQRKTRQWIGFTSFYLFANRPNKGSAKLEFCPNAPPCPSYLLPNEMPFQRLPLNRFFLQKIRRFLSAQKAHQFHSKLLRSASTTPRDNISISHKWTFNKRAVFH